MIPRPASATAGEPAPWAHLPSHRRHLTLDGIRAAFADAPDPLLTELEGTGRRASAVLAALYEHEGIVHVVLTRRAQHMRSHRGEVSFPGGGQDPGEELWDTARREAFEEVALDPESVELIGEIDHLTTVIGQASIIPYVGVLPGRPDLVANATEVELILHVSLDELLLPEVFHEEWWQFQNYAFPVRFFEIPGDTIWGATGTMLYNLLALLTGTTWR